MKVEQLRELRVANRDYILSQMQAKAEKKEIHREVKAELGTGYETGHFFGFRKLDSSLFSELFLRTPWECY